jgi:PKD repeat protein
MTRRGLRLVAASIVLSAACTVHQTEAPPLTGPSELALSLTMAASPDHVTQDGSSTATIAITARDVNGKPLPNVELRFDIAVNNQITEFGSLSSKTAFTNSSGRAAVVYTAPAASPFLASSQSTVVSIIAEPVGTNYAISNFLFRQVDLLVAPPPPPPPVVGAPTASVTYSPASPKVGQLVTFNAAASAAQAGHQIVTWYWDFGDGLANDEHGNDASHVYQAAGTYYMVLGVTDDAQRMDSDVKTIVVTP